MTTIDTKSKFQELKELLKKRILVLDGAMGTMIQALRLDEKDFRGSRFRNHEVPLQGNYDLLSLTQPHLIQNIHEEYLKAGADIIETNTFNANLISQEKYQLTDFVYEINYQSAKIAREVADRYSTSKKNDM
ncbi:MAG: homocysteine S-methyltransferase family protein [Leptospiraceae bacterium]|nr:homocysteine S-methyltransferase family protein [Leptospiraceae bacterium]